MGQNTSDLQLLLTSTLSIYKRSLAGAFKACVLNWRALLVQFAFLFAFAILMRFVPIFGALAGGFIMGMILAVVLGIYFATVAAGVIGETIKLNEMLRRGFDLFSPVISVLFLLFIVKLICDSFFASPEQFWILASVNLFITVLFNPIPEVVYQRSSGVTDMFATSFEFIKENFVEWFLPVAVMLLPVAILSYDSFVSILIIISTTNPFYLVEKIILSISDIGLLLSNFVVFAVFIVFLYFAFVFRGLLYEELSTSSRRKRIYQQRTS